MTNRNLQFYGFAYGDTPVTLDVTVNGQTVFSNTVTTTPGTLPIESSNSIVCDQVLFEINGTSLFPTEFSGHYPHSVTVTGGSGVFLCDIKSNYMAHFVGNTVTGGTATSFVNVYDGVPANSEGTPDSRSSVYIDGIQQEPLTGPSQGTWTWTIYGGSTLSCNLNVGIGNVAV